MPPQESSAGPATSLTTALRLLRDRWWVLLVCLVLGAAALVARDSTKTKLYESTATLLFGTTGTNVSGVLNGGASNVSTDPERDQGTTLLLVTSSSVADRVKKALNYGGGSGDLTASITASARSDANLIDVTASDPEPARAAQLANAFAEQYQAFRGDTDRSGLQQGIANLRTQLNSTPQTDQVQRRALQDSITSLVTSEATTTGGVQVVDRATPSGSVASPRPKRDAVLGAILGLAVGVALVFAIDLLDRRLRTVRDFELAYDQTALAGVPQQRQVPRTSGERQAALEPYRILRVSLAQVSRRPRPRIVLLTSAVSGEGKSTTAAGLARAVAYSGQRVALVELDLRRPTFHQQFNLPRESAGLSSLLQGRATLDDVLSVGVPELPTLEVIPAGGIPARSAELLSGPYMRHVLRDLAERFEVVILDAPPLLPVADTHAVLDNDEIDTVLVVGKPQLTTRDQAARVRTILAQHDWTAYGVVVNGLKRDEATYDYGYDHSEAGEQELPRARAEESVAGGFGS